MLIRRTLVVGVVLFAWLRVASAEWETDYGKALAAAKAQNKRVLVNFTGSDWCPPCMALRKQVFSRPQFRAYAQKKLILVEVDFPKRKKQPTELQAQNEKLAVKYGIEEKGFPTIVLLNPAGKALRELTGYEGEPPAGIIAWIEGKKK